MPHESIEEVRRFPDRFLWMLKNILAAGLILVIVATWGYVQFGSFTSALAYARGDRLIADSKSLFFGQVVAGPTIQQHTRLTNHANRAIKLVGSNASCACVLSEDLPLTIAPGNSHLFRIGVKTDKRSGAIREQIALFTDFPKQSEIVFSIRGEILLPAPAAPSNGISVEGQ